MTDAELERLLLPNHEATTGLDQDDQPLVWEPVAYSELPVDASVLEARIAARADALPGGLLMGLQVERLHAVRSQEHLTAPGEAPMDPSHFRVVASVRLADGSTRGILAEVTVEDGRVTGREPVSFTVAY